MGSSFDDHIQDGYLINGSRCSLNALLSNIWEIAPIVLGIPLYKFIVHPLLRGATPTTLQAMGIGMFMGVASMVSFMSIDLAGHYLDNNATCFLNDSVVPKGTTAGGQLPVSSYLLTLPFLLGTLADIFTYIAGEYAVCRLW